MSKPISKDAHILIDYSYAAIVPLLPELLGFKNNFPARTTCRLLGVGALAYILLTKARRTPFEILPFKAHLLIDAYVSLLAAASPWLLRFSRKTTARNALLAVGVAGLSASLLTESKDENPNGREQLFI